ncbi:hypothetical protein [Bradyrhizobium sp. HKCCYLR20261]|uniref:hypothetical protein n=1 Tax=Bradyrhizobium sp. HKCCYLR20261 TaxID=3420760 RepID=UPI003EB768A1
MWAARRANQVVVLRDWRRQARSIADFSAENPRRRKTDFARAINRLSPAALLTPKIPLSLFQNPCFSPLIPLRHKGRFAIVTRREAGMRWP